MEENHQSQPIYSSKARGCGNKNRYRIYADRLELDLNFLFIKKNFVIPAHDIIDIWTSPPSTLKSIPRMGGWFKAIGKGLKLDLADMFEHVGIQCHRDGYFKFFFFAPEDPAGFVAAVKNNLMKNQ